ncbi:MAG: universal stress protein [Bacteroidota bacterium]
MKTILFPTDFSSSADNALSYAAVLCNDLKAKLVLFHSFHIPAYASPETLDDATEEQLTARAENDLLKLRNKVLAEHKELEIECIVNLGLAVDRIISSAAEKHADMIIMGTKGASGLKEIFVGSNASAVLDKAPCPVLVIPDKAAFKGIAKIVFATNYQESDFQSIKFLTEIASLFNAEILIVHISEFTQADVNEKDLQWFKDELKKKSNILYENISFHNLIGGNVDWELEEFIEQNNIDLLSLSMRKRNIFTKLFDRSLTKKMAYHSHVPMLAFHAAKHIV